MKFGLVNSKYLGAYGSWDANFFLNVDNEILEKYYNLTEEEVLILLKDKYNLNIKQINGDIIKEKYFNNMPEVYSSVFKSPKRVLVLLESNNNINIINEIKKERELLSKVKESNKDIPDFILDLEREFLKKKYILIIEWIDNIKETYSFIDNIEINLGWTNIDIDSIEIKFKKIGKEVNVYNPLSENDREILKNIEKELYSLNLYSSNKIDSFFKELDKLINYLS